MKIHILFISIVLAAFSTAEPCQAKSLRSVLSDTFSRVSEPSASGSYQYDDQVIMDGVLYTRYASGRAMCRVAPKYKGTIVSAIISPQAIINGESLIVDVIEEKGFADCNKLQTVTIPATVKTIKALAFMDDKNLETVVFQSDKIEFEFGKIKWAHEIGVFVGCNKVSKVVWPTSQIPSCAWIAFSENTKSPYVKNVLSGKGVHREASGPREMMARVTVDHQSSSVGAGRYQSFREFLEDRVTKAYNSWQKKKQYESPLQYAERTSSANREKKKKELFEAAKSEYIDTYAPTTISGRLQDYDTDYKVYTIEVPSIGEIYAQVPLSERSYFEDNWTGAYIKPTFNIIDNELKVVACEYKIGDHTYYAPELYDDKGDDVSMLEFDARQLDLDDLMETDNTPTKSKAVSTPVNTAPTTGIHNPNTYALIIGNENYKYVEPVGYALADATTFARYCKNTLGIPMRNIIAVQDVTRGELRRTIKEMQGFFEDDGDNKSLVVYYAGHGIPDPKNADSMILPVDASASDPESCYSVQEFYNTLGEFGAKNVVVFMDACFTGATRKGTQMVASRAGVDFVRSQVEPRGNTVVISATSANETAQPYNEKGHGIFTYYLLEKLQSSQGNVSLGDLADYVTTKVKSQSMHATGKKQVPSTLISPTFKGDWRTLPVSLKIPRNH